jgi:pimeloyl-ACP methyl ester carboxylesterase
MTTYVLVHGAWHGGWCWQRVVPLLRDAGHDVRAPTLAGCGERAGQATPDVGLATHVEEVVQLLEREDLREVVLVGTDYSALVIAGVADQVPERLAHLVYLDALLPQDGQSWADLVSPMTRVTFDALIRSEGDGQLLPRPQVEHPFGIRDAGDAVWLNEQLTDMPAKTWREPLRLANSARDGVPRTYVYCTGNIGTAAFAERAREEGSGWAYRELASGHDAMIVAPRELADLLLDLAA